MRAATWYFDIISPFAYLALTQFHTLPEDLDIEFVPVLFAGLLKSHGHKGPAEIEAKRTQTYRMCVWQARQLKVPFTLPPAHPFNPLPLLRLLVGAGATCANTQAVFEALWAHGEAPGVAFDALAARFGVADPQALIADAVIKQTLNDNTARALARGVYGVPTFDVGGELFWGLDAMPLLSAYLANPQLFASGELRRAGDIPVAQARKSTT